MLNRKNVKVLVVGEDNKAVFEKQAERLRVSAQILFLGAAASMRDSYATSDVFILPTYYEAFSLASLEAAASGLPLLATRVNGTEELIVEGENGFFIERDAENISEKVRMLLDDKAQRDALGSNARKSAEKYSWDAITQRTLEVYKQIQ
jgi:UDP-glucose:(heptosyl)LPS alpha-1,3-glucosyltransferase